MKELCKRMVSFILCTLLLFAASPAASAAEEQSGDPQIRMLQQWLNEQYGGVSGFGSVAVDGITGQGTVNGLLRALQHELGIASLANSFGSKTSERYSQNPLERDDYRTDNKFAILQGALWCKGYNPGYNMESSNGRIVFKAVFDETVENAVIELKRDMGFENPDGVVTLNVMKALLSMDSFKLLPASYGAKAEIRAMQQKLNRKYVEYIGIIPCDGIYSRNINNAVTKALQAEECNPKSGVDGVFGDGTKQYCPELPYIMDENAARDYNGKYYTDIKIRAITELMQFLLWLNGYSEVSVNGSFDAATNQAVIDFQKIMALPQTKYADKATMLSLFISKGDSSRYALAADCATVITEERAKTLRENGYRYIGRYLTGSVKAITRAEAEIIFDAGLRFFPIYQTTATAYTYFSAEQGIIDANNALSAASSLGIPENTIIYFAVDCDVTEKQIESYIKPHFKSINEQLANSPYRIGIYGTRSVCTEISNIGYAKSTFVSDMSTGFNGNIGVPIPDNWAFDQFATVTIGNGNGEITIDKNAFSGRDSGVSYLMPTEENSHNYIFSGVTETGYAEPESSVYSCTHCEKEYHLPNGFALCDFNLDGLVNDNDNAWLNKYGFSENTDISVFDFDKDNAITEEFDRAIIKLIALGFEFSQMVDLNQDGNSDILDLVRAKRFLADGAECDINKDGNVNAKDIIFVCKFLLLNCSLR